MYSYPYKWVDDKLSLKETIEDVLSGVINTLLWRQALNFLFRSLWFCFAFSLLHL